ncbi:MAG: VanZ family protein [Clostridia bacterium]|nr:VanZ family protein [Clostridia bacterium]
MFKKTSPFIFIFALISFTALVCFFLAESIDFNHSEKIVAAFVMFFFGFLSVFFACQKIVSQAKRKKWMKAAFIAFFVLYFIMFLNFTLMDGTFGRKVSSIFLLDAAQIREYVKTNTNLTPFATVKIFAAAYNEGTLSMSTIIENILGNLFILAPFSLFAPCAFKGMNKPVNFFVFCCILVSAVELLQFVFMTGSADIDDFILNILGAIVTYWLLNIGTFKRFVSGLTLGLFGGEENENSGKRQNKSHA